MLKSTLLRSTAMVTGFGLMLLAGAAHAGIIQAGSVTPAGLGPGDTTVDGGIRVGSTAAGSLDVNGGSTLTVDQIVTPTATLDGARINVGVDGTGTFTIDNGTVNLNAGAGRFNGARLQISNQPAVNAPAQPGIVNMSNGAALNLDGVEQAGISVGRDGFGSMTASDSTIDIDSASGSANIFVGGGAAGQPNLEGHLTLQNATVTIDSGATDGSSAAIFVGRTANTVGPTVTNMLSVESGSTIVMDNTGNGSTVVNVGQNGANGAMTVSGGSAVTMNSAGGGSSSLSVGRSGAGTGTLTVTGTGSALTVGDFVSIGRDGATGVLDVADNATLDNTAGNGLTRLGRNGGFGTLNVTGGGNYAGADIRAGEDTGANGAVNVNSGGAIDLTNRLSAGWRGAGEINIGDDPSTVGTVEAGGTVNARALAAGFLANGNGTINVNNGGQVNLGGVVGNPDGAILHIGRSGTGVVNVAGGAITVDQGGIPTPGTSGGLLIGGSGTDPATTGDGTLNVDGSGLVLLNSGFTQVGRQGTGAMNITGGGNVNGLAQNVAVVGRIAGSSGAVNIDGPGSNWLAGNNLFIGTDVDFGTATASGPGGTGVVTLSNGGGVSAGNILVGGAGTLQGNGVVGGNVVVDAGGTLSPGNSPGTLQIVGNLDLGVSSNTLIELGGLSQGTTYDLIDVTDDGSTLAGIATLMAGAIFDVSYFGAFTASLGDVFDVLVADDIVVSDLSAISFLMPTLSAGFIWDRDIVLLETGREALRLFVAADGGGQVPAPPALLLFAPALGALVAIRRRKRRA